MPIQNAGYAIGQSLLRPPFQIDLSGGETFTLPIGQGVATKYSSVPNQVGFITSGEYFIDLGKYLDLEWFDPNLQIWKSHLPYGRDASFINSDGSNWRVANSTGCAVGAVITNGGTGLTDGSNTVAVTASDGSTWNTLVGGSINTTVAITNGGTGYNHVPQLIFNPPLAQGNAPYVLPTAVAAVSGGAISSVTVKDAGAGFTAAGVPPTITVIPDARDTAAGGAVLTVNATLTNSGVLTWMGPATYGTPSTSAVTFTFSPASSIAATAVMNFTVTGFTVGTVGAALGTSLPFLVLSGGPQVVGSTLNPGTDAGVISPRQAVIAGTSTSGGAATATGAVIQDAGYGLSAVPNLFVIPSNLPTTWPVLNATVGATIGRLELLPL